MNEAPLLIKGVPVKCHERIGNIDGTVHWGFELTDGTFLTLTSHELNMWQKASQHEEMEPEPAPQLNVMQSAGITGLIVGAVAAIWTVWAAKVGLL